MTERCPLGSDLYWDNETPGIPQACQRQCSKIWDAATQSKPDGLDTFDSECEHPVEYGGTSLQRSQEAQRIVGILQLCMQTGDEAFAEDWSFTCPFEEVK